MLSVDRRRFLGASAAALAGALSGCGGESAQTDTGTTDVDGTGTAGTPSLDDARVGLERVAEGFAAPVDLCAPAGVDRRFVVDQPGVVWSVTGEGRAEKPYLDLRDRVVEVSGYSERGLLGMAAHPDFAENGRLFVRYSAPNREGTPSNYSHTFVLSELTVDPGADDPSPEERTLLEIPEPQPNHNAGSVVFGPDGYLYVGVGDGGGSEDRGTGHVEDWYDAVPGGNGQDVTANRLGSVLRIDVDEGTSSGSRTQSDDVDSRTDGKPYGIPEDNPLVGREGFDEQYAWGFRNPWRVSFDGEDLYVADVGESAYEEVNRVTAGGNYGWNVREGAHCFGADSCPAETADGEALVDPVIEYSHSGDGPSGAAVIGGYVYRGDEVPALSGAYVFADWQADGRLFAATPDSSETPWPISEVSVVGSPSLGSNVLAFGRDGEEVYVLANEGGVSGSSGTLSRLVAP
ncbi:PQQ-dependent sugar dehydrogenase [Halopelagius longus]|uniref:Glucose/arabinose dehydrogenase, beta-propeller fold n=1 Tax=Halopelagius longus TaxID=1236180 RepID=A0A1H1BTN5_9EURY|nr:PQQ-dependent sugar dehydrogenase [Halopelagius longus]RDI70921.1 sugar dehydrogenase [Halopelagius longus]SDQ55308.1 Glucose/arabinose dehydrogenase, beta-propeller fold [Halopelagius longus]